MVLHCKSIMYIEYSADYEYFLYTPEYIGNIIVSVCVHARVYACAFVFVCVRVRACDYLENLNRDAFRCFLAKH